MSTEAEIAIDAEVRALCEARNYGPAATRILEAFGGDLVRVIHARFRDDDATAEVFSRTLETLWLALPAFGFRCSVRTWLLTLARNAGSRYLSRDRKPQRANIPLSEVPELVAPAVALRTLTFLRTESKNRTSMLRSRLREPDQLLLTLRLDQLLEFKEIALVFLEDADADSTLVAREAARLRKRFQFIKEELRIMLRETP